jgi:hypothetical protein
MTKTYRIKPDLRILYPWVLLSLGLLLLLAIQASFFVWNSFGFSVLLVWIVYRRLNQENYILGDHSIQIETRRSDQTILLHDITGIQASRSWWLAAFDLGEIELTTSSFTIRLKGIKDPVGVGAILQKAVDAAIERRSRQQFKVQAAPELHLPGTLETLNDLVGLWQQGMIDDATFETERRRLTKTD